MNIPKAHLKPKLGFITLLAIAVGVVVGQGPIMSVLQGIGFGGTNFIIALGLGLFISLCNASTFAELSLMMPRAGSLSTYTEVSLGHFLAITATFAGYVVPAMFGLSAEMMLVGGILDYIAPGAASPLTIAIVVVGILTILNILGTDIFASVQNFLTYLMIVSLSVAGFIAFTKSGVPVPNNYTAFSDWGGIDTGVLGLMTLSIWAFLGLEFVCPMIEESKNPNRNIPRSMFIGAFLIFLVYSLFVLGAGTYVSREALSSSEIPHLDYAIAVFGESAGWLVAIIALTASGSTVNTVIASVGRMIYGMAENGQAFGIFKTLHPKTQTPWVALLFMGVIIILPLAILGHNPDMIITLLIAAAAAWLFAYIIAHLDLIVLRKLQPNAKRPYKTPFYPIPQIIGIVAMVYLILNNSPSPEMTKQVYTLTGVVLLVIAVIAAIWVKFVMKKGLFEREPFEFDANE